MNIAKNQDDGINSIRLDNVVSVSMTLCVLTLCAVSHYWY